MIQFIITKESVCVSICCRNGETTHKQWAKLTEPGWLGTITRQLTPGNFESEIGYSENLT
jgi:hypothetical protein